MVAFRGRSGGGGAIRVEGGEGMAVGAHLAKTAWRAVLRGCGHGGVGFEVDHQRLVGAHQHPIHDSLHGAASRVFLPEC